MGLSLQRSHSGVAKRQRSGIGNSEAAQLKDAGEVVKFDNVRVGPALDVEVKLSLIHGVSVPALAFAPQLL